MQKKRNKIMDLSTIPVIIMSFLGISATALAVVNYIDQTNVMTCPSGYSSCTISYFVNGNQVGSRTIYIGQTFQAKMSGNCVAGYTGNLQCSGNYLQKEYKNSDCSLVWKNYKNCQYGCSNNQCNQQTTTIPTTTTSSITTTTVFGSLLNPPINQNGITIIMNDGSSNLRYDTNQWSPSVLNYVIIKSSTTSYKQVYVCVNNPSGTLRFRIWGSNIRDMQGSSSYMSGSDTFNMPVCPNLFYIGSLTYANSVQLPVSGYIQNNVGTPSGSLSFQIV